VAAVADVLCAAGYGERSPELRSHFIPALGHLALTAIPPIHVRGVVDSTQRKGLAPKSICTYVGTLSAIFSAAVEAALIPRTPVRGLHLESPEAS
jgi:hypothetical protein